MGTQYPSEAMNGRTEEVLNILARLGKKLESQVVNSEKPASSHFTDNAHFDQSRKNTFEDFLRIVEEDINFINHGETGSVNFAKPTIAGTFTVEPLNPFSCPPPCKTGSKIIPFLTYKSPAPFGP